MEKGNGKACESCAFFLSDYCMRKANQFDLKHGRWIYPLAEVERNKVSFLFWQHCGEEGKFWEEKVVGRKRGKLKSSYEYLPGKKLH
jgi:hypothetical protein